MYIYVRCIYIHIYIYIKISVPIYTHMYIMYIYDPRICCISARPSIENPLLEANSVL